MGTRLALRFYLLCTLICVCINLASCNKNPASQQIKANSQQTTTEEQIAPPVELWRKQVATRPKGDGTLAGLKGMTFQEIVDENGWSSDGSPILLNDGSLLSVTSNHSQKELSSYQHLYPGMERLTDPYGSFEVFRLVIVGSDGKIKKHKKFLWTNDVYIAADPSGENLAIVALDEYNRYKEYDLEGSRLIGLDFELNENWETNFEGGLGVYSLVLGENAIYICSRTPYDFSDWGENRGDENELNAFDYHGNPLWTTNLSNTGIQSTMALGWSFRDPMSLGNSGNLFLVDEKGNLISISKQGDLLWSTALGYHFDGPPLQLPNGNIVLTEDNLDTINLSEDAEKYRFSNLESSVIVLSSTGEELTQVKLDLTCRTGLVPFGNDSFIFSTSYFDPSLGLYDPELGVPSRVICMESDGTKVWQTEFGISIGEISIFGRSLHVTQDNQTYVFGAEGSLHKLDQNGDVLWNRETVSGGLGGISLGKGRIYLYSFSGDLVCYEEQSPE